MASLSIINLAYFGIYFLIVFLIGIISSRKKTEDGFMIAERKIEGIQVAATMSAGWFDGCTLSVYVAYVFLYGFSAMWMFIGLALGYLLIIHWAPVIKKNADRLHVYSMPEYFYKIFGKRTGLVFSVFLIVQFFLLLVVNLIVSGKVLALAFPVPYWLGVIISGAIILTYLLLAGFKAVVKTDFFQLLMMFILIGGAVLLFVKKVALVPLHEFSLANAGAGNTVGFLVLGIFSIFAAPDLWQRIFATKDRKNLKFGIFYALVIIILLGLLVTTIGLVIKASLPGILPEDAFAQGYVSLLPAFLLPFGMMVLYAVTLSSSDTLTFVVSSIVTRDLKNYTRKYSEASMIVMTRFFIVIFIVSAGILSIFYQKVISLGLSLTSLNLGLFPVIFGSFYWKLKERAVFWSLVIAFASEFVLFFSGQLSPVTAVLPLPVCLVCLVALQKILK